VVDVYRRRWSVELNIKVDKLGHRLDAIDAERPCSLTTLLHAWRIACILAALRAHTHDLKTRPTEMGAPRTEVTLHTMLLALQLAVPCPSIAQVFDLRGTAAKRRWDKITELFTHAGTDPDWRRRPAILDQLRG
jgi:hypothetical protein